jgi:DNA-binding response OmpR family regulator
LKLGSTAAGSGQAERCEYLGKPFAPEVLVAKLELAKRVAPSPLR